MALKFACTAVLLAAGVACVSAQDSAREPSPSAPIPQKISGLALILKSSSLAGDMILHAGGYRIRIPAGAATFSTPLNTLADVTPGVWIRYEGTLDPAGILLATKAEFFPPGTHKTLTSMGPRKMANVPDYQPVTADSLLDANGNFADPHTKVRLSDAGGPCGWHRVPADAALQERVSRIGARLIPEYQKQLARDNPARIPFRFYAVTDDKVRSVFACNTGLVLVPKNVLARLQTDDQLASVMADGVAFQIERQLVTVTPLTMARAGSFVVELIPGLSPGAYIAGEAVEKVANHEAQVKLQHDVARIALQLLSDSGFDPWQAPDAWRLLAPKDPPHDIQSVKYTHEGKYQRGILDAQYKRAAPAPAVTASLP